MRTSNYQTIMQQNCWEERFASFLRRDKKNLLMLHITLELNVTHKTFPSSSISCYFKWYSLSQSLHIERQFESYNSQIILSLFSKFTMAWFEKILFNYRSESYLSWKPSVFPFLFLTYIFYTDQITFNGKKKQLTYQLCNDLGTKN